MTIYSAGDVVVVPFPFVDSTQAKPRPALVLSSKCFNSQNLHTILCMITTGAQTQWRDDIVIKDWKNSGLTVPSIIRMKLFTLDNRIIKHKIGQLSEEDKAHTKTLLHNFLIEELSARV